MEYGKASCFEAPGAHFFAISENARSCGKASMGTFS
jgi:hypothetical protein